MREGETLLRTGSDAVALLAPRLRGLRCERLVVAFLDAEFRLLHLLDDAIEQGAEEADRSSARRIVLPVRQIIRHALECEATGLILAHNHPSGDPTPSAADLAATRVLADTARGLRIRLIDHLVVAGERCTSFRARGLL